VTKYRHRLGGLVAAFTLGLLAAFSGPQAQPAAADDPAAECMGSGGIYVYILYEGSLVTQGCSTANTGYQRIKQVTSVEQTGGFVCRIAGMPEKCIAPHSGMNVYWTYWWWRDGAWTYANQGGGYRGIPGTAEAWNYSAGQMPGLVPPAPQAPQPNQPEQPQQPAEKPQQPEPRQPETRPDQPQRPAEQPNQPDRQPNQPEQRPEQPAQTQPQADQSTQPAEQPSATSPSAADASVTSASAPQSNSSTSPASSATSEPSSTTTAFGYPIDDDPRSGTPWATLGVLAVLAGAGGGYLLWRNRK